MEDGKNSKSCNRGPTASCDTKRKSTTASILQCKGAKAYKAGSKGIRVVLQHKEHALKFFLKQAQIPTKNVLIMADQAKRNQIDRRLLIEFPDATSINVGRYSGSLFRRNTAVVQMDRNNRGVKGGQAILEMLVKRNGIPERMEGHGAKITPVKALEDAAMLEMSKGGIDFNTNKMNLLLQHAGQEIKFHIDPAMLDKLQNVPGFMPVIINIQPMTDLKTFLLT